MFFIFSWGGQFVTQLQVAKQQDEQHGQAFSMREFWPELGQATFENWQSERLQLFAQAVLVSGFASVLFRKQDEEHFKTHLMLEDIQKQLDKQPKKK